MTSLSNLLMLFAGVGMVLTILTYMAKKTEHVFWTFLQHFCGVWFVFSGLVKAVDPIGTAYKMEDYFVQFESTFAGLTNFFSGFAPLFPFLSKYSAGFSIFMVVLEIALGAMLMLGFYRKLTAWLFFLIVVFFTALTGFTFLTGYVPAEANFFDFAKWGPYIKTQMRVTDCGCFGDFIKLDPRISFYKDLGLLVPAFAFLFRSRNMHQLFSTAWRNAAIGATTLASLVFCFQNTYWDLPVVDFRPFAIGTNVREKKATEEEARGNVEITGWLLENEKTGQFATYMEPEPGKITYYKQFTKADGWKVKDQIKTDPFIIKVRGYELLNTNTQQTLTVEMADTAAIFKQYPEADGWQLQKEIGDKVPVTETKVSDFAVEDPKRGDVTEEILGEEGYSLMIVAYHFEGEKTTETYTVQDTTWAVDTLQITPDSMALQRRVESVETQKLERVTFAADPDWEKIWREKVNPFAEAAEKAGWKVYAITTYADAEAAPDFRHDVQAAYPFYKADDKLLKTIIRSNPGVVIWKDGSVVDMYHHRKLPTFEAVQAKMK